MLGVTVIDPACGSGHFLLAAARRIATRVARARTAGVPSTADYRHALRDAVRSCVHGVDRNPMAVELARVALWIETVEPGKPLGFLDANLRVGDSLLGIFSLDALRIGIPDAAYKPLTGDDKATARDFDRRNRRDKGEAAGILDFSGRRAQPVELPPLAASLRAVRELPEDTVQQVQAKRDRFQSTHSDPRLVNLAQAADLYIAAFLTPKTEAQSLDLQTSLVPTTADVWTALRSGTVYGPRLGAARQLALTARAFHWPFEFPDVMASGGFDAVLGNPPWERIKLQEQEFFASREPSIAEAPEAATRRRMIQHLKEAPSGTREHTLLGEFELSKRIAEASSEFARVKLEDQGRFPLTGSGDVNTYALFAELFVALIRERGRAGVIVPTGIATDATTARFFGYLVERGQLSKVISFENEEFIFPSVHHAFKFCLLVATGSRTEASEFAFFLRRIDQLAEPERCFVLSPAEIAQINPNTKTAPVFRARADAELTARIYSRCEPIEILSGQPHVVGLQVRRFLDMNRQEIMALVSLTPSQERIPVYEGKLFWQSDHRHATYRNRLPAPEPMSLLEKNDPTVASLARYWIERKEVVKRLADAGWTRNWLIGLRDFTNTSNERTTIASAFPLAGTDYTVRTLLAPEYRDAIAFLACANTLVFDFVARTKLGGTHVAEFVFQQLPVLPASYRSDTHNEFIFSRVLELTFTSDCMAPFAQDLGYGGAPFAWDEDRRSLLRAELDAWYARAYGLTRDELRYILDPTDVMGPDYPSETFRVLKNSEMKRFGEYRTRRLVLDAWDRMERGELHAPEPYDRRRSAPAPFITQAEPVAGTGDQGLLQFTPEPSR